MAAALENVGWERVRAAGSRPPFDVVDHEQ